jgi:bifunctional non-homologous end joining protein LigD
MPSRATAGFIEPMRLLKQDALPDDPARWQYELKFDGYRAVAFKSGGRISLRSRNDKDFSAKYPSIVRALAGLPDDTVIDGEVVALDDEGRPSFAAMQHAGPATPVVYFVFDVMMIGGVSLRHEALDARRGILERKIAPVLADPALLSQVLSGPLPALIAAVKEQAFEGLVAKRRDSRYEPGLRSGVWRKMRIDRGQEFVIGGYSVGSSTFDAIVVGYYDADRLLYAARTRNGFTPATRAALWQQFRGLEIAECPFANLPEARSGRWGQGLTAAKMAECRWLKPVLVAQLDFLEWTADNHLRHARFVGLRDDKRAREVGRE